MKKLTLALLLSLASGAAFSAEITGQLIGNDTSVEEACKGIYKADDRCVTPNDYLLSAIVANKTESETLNDGEEVEAVIALIKKSDFESLEGKTVTAKYEPGQFAEIIETK
ncbi:hypothetical protein [Methylotenera versatilis]|uniref:hypothetical protein n=1 Tax=Methylotenera versatilis TaxID=1055487 RepID=UPI00064783A7|nr:hypothetical protein [Methylotenera versatilis]